MSSLKKRLLVMLSVFLLLGQFVGAFGMQSVAAQNITLNGHIDSITIRENPTGHYISLTGWVCAPQEPNHTIRVDAYQILDSGPRYIGSLPANQPRESAVGTQCGGNSSKGFSRPLLNPLLTLDVRDMRFFAVYSDNPPINVLLSPPPPNFIPFPYSTP